jgi:hypothetical protein
VKIDSPAARSVVLGAVVATSAAALLLPAAAGAKKPAPPPTPAPTPQPAPTSTYVRNYANVVSGTQYDVTPEDVAPTSDGGSLDLGTAQAPSGVGVAWLVKQDSFGSPQWEREVGCLGTPPGAYSDELSVTRTSDGGALLAGGTVGCGSDVVCPPLSGLQCGLLERLDGSGAIVWARAYFAGADGSVFDDATQAADGGFVAVGSATDAHGDNAALIVEVDASGNVQWQQELGPTGNVQGTFDSVAVTADGGYVATGTFYSPTTGSTPTSVLVAKFDSAGRLVWERGLAGTNATGGTTNEHALSLAQTSDGGYAIAGNWNSTTGPGTCCSGALLLKLDATGALQWQRAYSSGVHCFSNGYSDTCTATGGIAYSLHQTADGGYVLAGGNNVLLGDEAPLVPWLAKTDGNGAPIWQENDYQVNPATQRPLSEYFASAAVTPAGYLALGWTENLTNGKGELLGVQTDGNGAVGTCSQVHAASLSPIDPELAAVAPGLQASRPTVTADVSPAQSTATSIAAPSGQC